MPRNTDIKYIYIEVVYNSENSYYKDRHEILSGLLQGIKIKEGSTFVLLHGNSPVEGEKKATVFANLKFYDIMTIEVLHENHKDLTYFTTKKCDQDLALEILTTLHNTLLEDDMELNGEGLIDISKYNDVPEEYITNTKRKSINPIVNKVVSGFSNNRVNSDYIYTHKHIPVKKEEIVPSVFNRTNSKKPSKAYLVIMQEKINQINAGKFICSLPNTIEDQDEDAENLYEESNMHWA